MLMLPWLSGIAERYKADSPMVAGAIFMAFHMTQGWYWDVFPRSGNKRWLARDVRGFEGIVGKLQSEMGGICIHS